jgi:small subunit ribosomal protein S13
MEKIKPMIRIANTDLKGNKAIGIALTRVKGLGSMYSNLICKLANINPDKKAGLLEANEMDRLHDILANPDKYSIPDWMKNRRNDYTTGKDLHLITGDLQFQRDQDIRKLQKIRSYMGFRHAAGLPLRGQRTKSNFRKNKGKAVGVKRRAGAKSGRV